MDAEAFESKDQIKDKLRKLRYISEYVARFAATWDAVHYDPSQGIVLIPCDLAVAYMLAERSWKDIGCTLS